MNKWPYFVVWTFKSQLFAWLRTLQNQQSDSLTTTPTPPHPPQRKNFTLGSSSTGLVIMSNILKLRYAEIQTCCLNCMQLPLRRPYLHLSLYFLSWHHLDSMINMVFRATLAIWQCNLNVYDGMYYCLGNLICRKYVFNLFFKINNSTITLLEAGNKYK